LRDTKEDLEAAGIARAREHLSSADLRMILIDISQPLTRDDEQLLAEWPDALVVAHKADIATGDFDAWRTAFPNQFERVSSKTGTGVDDLQRLLVQRLVPHVPLPGTPIPVTQRQVAMLQAARSVLLSNPC
jgi:tRNA modification GTPase